MTVYFIFKEGSGSLHEKLYKVTHSLEEANMLVDSNCFWSKAVYVEFPVLTHTEVIVD